MTVLETISQLQEGQRIMIHTSSRARSTFIGNFVSRTFIRGLKYELILDEETEGKTLSGKPVYEKRFFNNDTIKRIEVL